MRKGWSDQWVGSCCWQSLWSPLRQSSKPLDKPVLSGMGSLSQLPVCLSLKPQTSSGGTAMHLSFPRPIMLGTHNLLIWVSVRCSSASLFLFSSFLFLLQNSVNKGCCCCNGLFQFFLLFCRTIHKAASSVSWYPVHIMPKAALVEPWKYTSWQQWDGDYYLMAGQTILFLCQDAYFLDSHHACS